MLPKAVWVAFIPPPPSRRPHSSSFLEATHWLPVFPFAALELVFTLSLK